MGGVLHDAVGFAGASCKENVQDGWERGNDDLCSRVHYPLEGLTVSSTAVPVPDSDAAGQHTLNGAPLECNNLLMPKLILKVPLLLGYESSYFGFGSPQQQVDMHARSKKPFHCLKICIYFFLFCSGLPNGSLNDSFFQTPPLRDANLQ